MGAEWGEFEGKGTESNLRLLRCQEIKGCKTSRVIALFVGDLSKSCGVMRLETRLQPIKEAGGVEEIVTSNMDNTRDVCEEGGKREGAKCKKTYLWDV